MPCLLDIDELNNLATKLEHRDDILFIAPALDRKDIVQDFLLAHPFKFKVAYSAMDVSQVFNKKQVYPSYFVIDRKGAFVYVDSGTKKSEFKNLEEAVYKVLEE